MMLSLMPVTALAAGVTDWAQLQAPCGAPPAGTTYHGPLSRRLQS